MTEKTEKTEKWRTLGLIFIILFCAFVITGLLIIWGDDLGYNTLGQKITVWLQVMLFVIGLLLSPAIVAITRRLWAKNKAQDESLNPTEKKKIAKPVPFSELVDIKDKCFLHYGLFWRRKIRKCLILGSDADTEALLPNLIKERWQLSDNTLMLYGGNMLDEPDVDWLKAVKKCFGRFVWLRRKPIDAIVWVLPQDYLNLNRKNQATLEKAALLMQTRNKALGWQAPIYLVSSEKSEWQQNGRIEQSVGALFNHLKINNIESVNPVLTNLASTCCLQGMNQIKSDIRYDFLLRLSQRLVQQDITRINQWLTKWLSLPNAGTIRGLFFSPIIKNDKSTTKNNELMVEHALEVTPTWQALCADARKQSGRRVGIAWETIACSIMLGITTLTAIGVVTSYYHNRDMITTATELVNQVKTDKSSPYADRLHSQYALQTQMGKLIYRQKEGAPLRYQFGLNKNNALLSALWSHYYETNEQNIAGPFFAWQTAYLNGLAAMSPADPKRAKLINSSYDVLKAYLMLGMPDKTDANYLSEFATKMWQTPNGVEISEWQKLMPELVAFWGESLPSHPEQAKPLSKSLIKDVRQILINQIGLQNAENTIYQAILQRAGQNFANVTLVQLLGDIDSRMLFTSNDEIQGVFTRKAWEDVIKDEIASAAKSRQEQIDWVLSDGSQVVTSSVSPEVLRQHLTERYFNDYGAAWLQFLNNIQWRQADNVADVIEQLTIMSDVRQSPLVALMNVVKYHGEVAYKGGGFSDSLIRSAQDLISEKDPAKLDVKVEASGPLTPTFGPVLNLMKVDNNNGLSLQTYLLRVTQVRLKLQNITASTNPQAMAKALAKSVFQGTSVDLTDTRDYGNLIAANLGEEWSGFGYSLFKQPLEQAWQVILTPAASSFNETWRAQIVYEWEKSFAGRYPFKDSESDASLAELARFLRPDAGVIDKFISSELGGILEKQGDKWVINPVNAQGLNFTPEFIETLNLFNDLSSQLMATGDAKIHFDLMARTGYNVVRSELIIDKQKLDYFNQKPVWQRFSWPGDGYAPSSQISWSSDETGLRLLDYYSGDWAWIRLLESAFIRQIDASRYELVWKLPDERKLKYILRSQLGEGPLTLLKLRDFNLPKNVFDIRKNSESQSITF
ncbi:ImcF-related family protein [Orbaceae bacterium ac157xtp]